MCPERTALNWSERQDSNLRHPGSKPGTLARLSYSQSGEGNWNRTSLSGFATQRISCSAMPSWVEAGNRTPQSRSQRNLKATSTSTWYCQRDANLALPARKTRVLTFDRWQHCLVEQLRFELRRQALQKLPFPLLTLPQCLVAREGFEPSRTCF